VSVYYGHLEILTNLISQGAKFEATLKGNTLLHIAAKKGYIDIVQYLLERSTKEQINSRKQNGMTPAMLAVQNNHLFVLKCLFDAGADLTLQMQGNVNILYMAA
jgi:uncharacterized protein